MLSHMSSDFLCKISQRCEVWFYCPNFKMKKQDPYPCDCRHDLTFTLGGKSAPSYQAHPGMLMSKPNSMLGHWPIFIFEYSISLEGCLGLLSLRKVQENWVVSVLILSYLQLRYVPTSIS